MKCWPFLFWNGWGKRMRMGITLLMGLGRLLSSKSIFRHCWRGHHFPRTAVVVSWSPVKESPGFRWATYAPGSKHSSQGYKANCVAAGKTNRAKDSQSPAPGMASHQPSAQFLLHIHVWHKAGSMLQQVMAKPAAQWGGCSSAVRCLCLASQDRRRGGDQGQVSYPSHMKAAPQFQMENIHSLPESYELCTFFWRFFCVCEISTIFCRYFSI